MLRPGSRLVERHQLLAATSHVLNEWEMQFPCPRPCVRPYASAQKQSGQLACILDRLVKQGLLRRSLVLVQLPDHSLNQCVVFVASMVSILPRWVESLPVFLPPGGDLGIAPSTRCQLEQITCRSVESSDKGYQSSQDTPYLAPRLKDMMQGATIITLRRHRLVQAPGRTDVTDPFHSILQGRSRSP